MYTINMYTVFLRTWCREMKITGVASRNTQLHVARVKPAVVVESLFQCPLSDVCSPPPVLSQH